MSPFVQTQTGVRVQIANRHCPHCKSVRVHLSRRLGVTDAVFRALGAAIRRCHDCGHRQAWFEVKALGRWGFSLGKQESLRFRSLGLSVLAVLLLGIATAVMRLRG